MRSSQPGVVEAPLQAPRASGSVARDGEAVLLRPMSPVVVRARAEMRARLPSMIALAILLGLGAGAVMTTAAGARRTDSSYRRFSKAYLGGDMIVWPSFGPQFASLDFDQVAKLPQVVAAARLHFLGTVDDKLEVFGDVPPFGVTIDRPKVLAGRMPNADAPAEAAVAFDLAKTRHIHVGDPLTVYFDTFDPQNSSPIVKTLRVVGIEASPGEFPPSVGGFGPNPAKTVHVSAALWRTLTAQYGSFDALVLRLRHGSADAKSVVNTLSEPRFSHGKPHLEELLADQVAGVQRSIHTQAVALWIVGALFAIIAALVLSQLLARQAVLDATENPTLLALGMTRTQVWMTGMARALFVGVCGALIGVAIAAAASPLLPFGTARIAEPHPGFALDFTVLALGAIATIACVCAFAAWPAWKSSRLLTPEGRSVDKPSLVGRAMPGMPAPVATGVRLALEPGRGRTVVPVRSSLVSVVLAIAALASALTFSAGMSHLLASPRLYGWNWDAHLTTTDNTTTAEDGLKFLMPDPRVQDIALQDTPPFLINDHVRFDSMAVKQLKGLISPVILDGRAPEHPGEIALGVKTLHDLHARIGSVVHIVIPAVSGTGSNPDFRIVGTLVVPPSSDASRLGVGGMVTMDSEQNLIPPGVQPPPATDLLIRLAPGVDRKTFFAELRQKIIGNWEVFQPTKPSDLVNFGQVQNLPLVLAGLVALIAVATLANTLITAIRRRRRDLAILKMLGFVPRQVRVAVAWQATTFVSVALLIGLPLGIAIGRTIWTAFAGNLGAVAEPVYPSLALLLTIPAAIVLANLIATVPAFIAARMKPAVVLRAE